MAKKRIKQGQYTGIKNQRKWSDFSVLSNSDFSLIYCGKVGFWKNVEILVFFKNWRKIAENARIRTSFDCRDERKNYGRELRKEWH